MNAKNEEMERDILTGIHLEFRTKTRKSSCIIGNVIAEGAMTQVYAAENEDYGKLAIQSYTRHLKEGNEPLSNEERGNILRRRRSAELLIGLSHGHLVRVIGMGNIFVSNNQAVPCIVMQHVTGENLHDTFHRCDPFAPMEALDIILQVGEALEYLHKNGLVHRAVRMENVIYRRFEQGTDLRHGDVVLAGTGLLREMHSAMKRQVTEFIPMDSVIFGLPDDDNDNRPYSIADEVFCLGWMLFQLIEGVDPYTSISIENPFGISQNILIMYESFRGIQRDDLSNTEREWLNGLCGKLLSVRKEYQYRTMAEVVADIDRVIKGLHRHKRSLNVGSKESLPKNTLPPIPNEHESLPSKELAPLPEKSSAVAVSQTQPFSSPAPVADRRSELQPLDDEEDDLVSPRSATLPIIAFVSIMFIIGAILLSPLRVHIMPNHAASTMETKKRTQPHPIAKKSDQSMLELKQTRIIPCVSDTCGVGFHDTDDTLIVVDDGMISISDGEGEILCRTKLPCKQSNLRALSVKGGTLLMVANKGRCQKPPCTIVVFEKATHCRILSKTKRTTVRVSPSEFATGKIVDVRRSQNGYDLWARTNKDTISHVHCDDECVEGNKPLPIIHYGRWLLTIKQGVLFLLSGQYQRAIVHHLGQHFNVSSVALSGKKLAIVAKNNAGELPVIALYMLREVQFGNTVQKK